MPVEGFIVDVCCCGGDVCHQNLKVPLRSRGFQPKLTSGEVIMMEIRR